MLNQHIALVPEAGGVNASELARVSAALQKQLNRDLAAAWGISATIDAFPYLEDVPLGYWPIVVTLCELGDEAGVQIDRSAQPYAQVEMSPDWSVHASRACLDMLVNPFGRRMIAGSSPRPDQGPVEFLVEVCGPCTGGDASYVIDDILVSDFCTPAYWGSSVSPGNSYSFAGTIQAAQHVSAGGHLIWHDPVSDNWWLRHHVADALVDTKLGPIDGRVSSVLEAVRARAPHSLSAAKMTIEAFEARLGVRRQHALQASQFQAHRLRATLGSPRRPWEVPDDPGKSPTTLGSPRRGAGGGGRGTLIASPAARTAEFDPRELDMGSTQDELRYRRLPAMLTRAGWPTDRRAPNGAELSRAVDEEVAVEVTADDFVVDDPRSEQVAAAIGAVTSTLDSNDAASVRSRPPPLPAKHSTIPPPMAVSYPPSRESSGFSGWLVGASAVLGAAAVMLVSAGYRGAGQPWQPTHAQAAAPAEAPGTTTTPSPKSTVPISPPTSALAATPTPNAATAVASAAVDHPEAAAPGSPVASPSSSVAAAPANRAPTSKPARSAVSQPAAPSPRMGRAPNEPPPDALDGLIVERR